MCGIAGYFGSSEIRDERIENCFSLMKRRGPDSRGLHKFRGPGGVGAVLLFSRLSILDLNERSNQPFAEGRQALAFNGEIYNYLELRKKLVDEGIGFHTESDTEVLFRLLDRKSPAEALDACEGMWSFAWLDEKDQTLLLSRDRFGEKPLYVLRDETGIYFGSEIKFLAALSGRKLKPDLNQIRRYLVNGYRSLYKKPHTFFEGVSEVPTGHFLRVCADRSERVERYWNPELSQHSRDHSMTYGQAVEATREALVSSVKLRLRADVPLAFCMSGGVDSNSLISIAKRVFNYDVHGFTIVNKDSRYEEQELVDYAVKELKIRHTAIPLEHTGFLSGLRELVRYHDAPVYTISYYAHWKLMKSIHEQGYKISLSGTAADELFSGYYDHHLQYLAMVKNDSELFQKKKGDWEKHVRPIVRNRYLQDPEAFIKNPALRDHLFMDVDYFRSYLNEDWHEPFTEESFCEDLLRNRMLNEVFAESVPVILHEDDLNAMYYSLENRSPFLDRNLFEVAFGIPTWHLVQDGMAKAVLRDAMKGIVPERIVTNRRKVGFNAPIFDLLNVKDRQVVDELTGDSPIWDIVRKDKIEAVLAHETVTENESKFLFFFINAKIFLEEFAA